MENLMNNITDVLILLFITITFLQSGLDKVFDWKGNLGFLKEHFSKTFLKSSVPLMLLSITVLEIIAGVLSLAGIIEFIVNGSSEIALYGVVFSSLVLLMLLFGQRIAKDYAGALTITCYFVISIFGVYIISAN
ncbi:DoxX family protein [Flavobacteriaceae bacterium R38]|nr:DoxX family protein [Flavobacteriaceae bacterium R38]